MKNTLLALSLALFSVAVVANDNLLVEQQNNIITNNTTISASSLDDVVLCDYCYIDHF